MMIHYKYDGILLRIDLPCYTFVKMKTEPFIIMRKKYYLLLFLLVGWSSCKNEKPQLTSIEYHTQSVDVSIKKEKNLTEMVFPYKVKLDKKMDEVLSSTSIDLTLDREINTLGNFVCDATMQYVETNTDKKIDICIMNNGGMRAAIFKGDITARSIYKLMPFDNKLITVKLKGEAMQELFDLVAKRREATSGLIMTVKAESPVNPMIEGEIFDFEKEYTVLTSDYLYHGGDNMTFFQKGTDFEDVNFLIRNVLVEYCKENPNGVVVDAKPRLL